MIIIYLIQIILTLFSIFISRKLYDYGNYKKDEFDEDDKVQFPIIAYFLFIVLNFIPIVGIISNLVVISIIIKSLIEEDLYYKPGKICKFLFKQI